ncbi:FKBP-type peptidyl-prolyl cis-trans isomerase SlyD [hydrothermal vent metagenome]|uniref:peptidylprolyl isomerase n=1 Tax=hydrothermal vent metagenome TaxID=652676 RepID=A0A3B1BZJ2_9ZZZZ
MQIVDNHVVTLDYTLTDDQGAVLDSSEGRGDFTYLHGASNIVPGLERALAGKSAGDELTVHIEPEEAYGERVNELVQQVPGDMFETEQEITVGMQFHAQAAEGQMVVVTVTEIDDETVTVDGNHPLAGKALNFEVKVIDIRDATEEELSHGHVHSGDCSHDH